MKSVPSISMASNSVKFGNKAKSKKIISSMGLSSEQFEELVNSHVKQSRFSTINSDNKKSQIAELLLYWQMQLLHKNRDSQIKELLEHWAKQS